MQNNLHNCRLLKTFAKIVLFLDSHDIQNKVRISAYFLNFSNKAKEQFEDIAKKTIIRQREIGHSIAFSTAGHEADELRYTLFIEQPDISSVVSIKRRYSFDGAFITLSLH